MRPRVLACCAGVAAALVASPSSASPKGVTRPAGGVCRTITAELLGNEKQLGNLTASEVGATAVEATSINASKAALYQEIALHRSELKARGCPAYPHVISPRNFVGSALRCQTADIDADIQASLNDPLNPLVEMTQRIAKASGRHSSESIAGAGPCDRGTWKR